MAKSISPEAAEDPRTEERIMELYRSNIPEQIRRNEVKLIALGFAVANTGGLTCSVGLSWSEGWQ